MKRVQKLLAASLSAALILALCPASFAAEGTRGKEEVVYINLDADGRTSSVNVVNIFELAQAGQIVDYGPYSAVRNMTGTEPVTLEGDTVTLQAGPGRVYYEGTLPHGAAPWLFDIRYFMNGREYDAADIAGMSGALELRLGIRENPDCAGDFFDSYALQATVTLDGDRCTDIQAPGATVADVGSDKQLTYTILPGKGAQITVRADVTDFAMDPISVNGVALSLDVQVDDEQLMDQVTELLDAIDALDEGAQALDEGVGQLEETVSGQLQSGADQLSQGASALQSGAGDLQSGGSAVTGGAWDAYGGASALDAGIRDLNGGLAQLQAGLDDLNGRSAELIGGSAEVLGALQQLKAAVDGNQLTDAELDQIRTGLASVQTGAESLATHMAGLSGTVASLQTLYSAYVKIADTLSSVIDGMNAAYNSIDPPPEGSGEGPSPTVPRVDMSGLQGVLAMLRLYNQAFGMGLSQASELSGLAETLGADLTAVGTAAAGLSGYLETLPGAMSQLQTNIGALAERYAALDAGIQVYAQGVADAAAGCGTLTAGGAELARGSGALTSGTERLYSGTAALLSGIVEIYNGAGALTDGAGVLDSGVAELLAGVAQLREGVGDMAQGTGDMAEQTDGMDKTIQDKIDGLLDSVTGGDRPVSSFVSEKNQDVALVQFVIRTPPIEKPVPAALPTAEPEEQPGFLDKLKDLFD